MVFTLVYMSKIHAKLSHVHAMCVNVDDERHIGLGCLLLSTTP